MQTAEITFLNRLAALYLWDKLSSSIIQRRTWRRATDPLHQVESVEVCWAPDPDVSWANWHGDFLTTSNEEETENTLNSIQNYHWGEEYFSPGPVDFPTWSWISRIQWMDWRMDGFVILSLLGQKLTNLYAMHYCVCLKTSCKDVNSTHLV